MIKSVTFTGSTGVLTFTKYDDTTSTVNLPTELIIESGSYDSATKDLTLVLASGDEIVIPLDDILVGIATESWVNTQLSSYYTKVAADALFDDKVYVDLTEYTNKAILIDSDLLYISDSASSYGGKYVTYGQIVNQIFNDLDAFDADTDYSSSDLGANFATNLKIYSVFGSSGTYGLNINDIQDGFYAIIEFPDTSADTSTSTQLTFDLGGNTRYLKLNGEDIAPALLSEQTLPIKRNGTVYELYENPSLTKILPYTGASGTHTTPKNGVDTSINREALSPIVDVKGNSVEQLISNPDFSDGTTGFN